MPAPREPGPSTEARAVAAAAFGSALVGTVPYFAIGLYKSGMDVASLLVLRYWIALVVLSPIAWWTSPDLRNDWAVGGRALFLNGLTLGMAQTFTYFRAVQSLPSSVVITVFFAYPIITLAIDHYLFAIRIRPASIAAVGLIFAGALLVGWPSLGFGEADAIGILCAVASPFLYAAYIAVAYRFTQQGTPSAKASSIYLGLGCGYALMVAIFGMRWPAGIGEWQSVVVIALVGGVIQVASFAYALPRLSAGRYSIIVSLELVTVVLIGVMVIGEHLALVQFVGVGLVCVGIIADRLIRANR
jgi:drug/metabolite transporter (DMT)-like permease